MWLIIIWSSKAANQSLSIHKRRGSHLYVTLRGIYTLKVFTQPLTRNILSTAELVTEGKALDRLQGRILHCKFLPHENYWDWELSPGFPAILTALFIDSAGFSYRDPAILSPCSFHWVKIAVYKSDIKEVSAL